MGTLLEKTKQKQNVLKYLNEIIDNYQEELNNSREDKKLDFKEGIIKSLLLALILVVSLSVTFATAGTALALPILIICTPILGASMLGLPVSISMLISYQRKLGKKVNELEKIINMAILREEYEYETLKELEESLRQNNYLEEENDGLTYNREKYTINKELETCAFNMPKLIKAKKSGKLSKFLWERYNVGHPDAIEMYENMIDLYLNNKEKDSTSLVSNDKKLLRK